MSIFAIGDLHLSFAPGIDKPMDVYGNRWHDHWKRLEVNWHSTISSRDTIIIPGDISWGLKLDEAKYDMDWIDRLPGKKVIFKGNHDLWWNGINRLNKMYDSITFVQNDFYVAEGLCICGTRGWITPDSDEYTIHDEKIYKRELLRLEASVAAGRRWIDDMEKELTETPDAAMGNTTYEMLGVLHFPPVSKPDSFSGFQQIFEDYSIKNVIYGHVHGEDGFRNTCIGNYHGVNYQLVSLDYLNCMPKRIKE